MKGFSLVECLCVLAIMSILGTMASYGMQNMMVRQQIKQAVRDLQWVRSDLGAYLIACDASPAMLTNGLSSLPHYPQPTVCTSTAPAAAQGGPIGGMVSSASLSGLVLTAVMGGSALPALKGQTVTLTAKVIGSAVVWSCTGPMGMIATAC